MTLSEHADLAIAVIVLFTIALPFTVWVGIKQGFSRGKGWFFLILLPIARIIGSALRIAADSDAKSGLFVAAIILSQLGLIPLLLALIGMLERVNAGMNRNHGLSQRVFLLGHLLALICLILAIVGSIKQNNADQDDQKQGKTMRRASSVLLLILWATLCALNASFIARLKQIWDGDRRIVFAGVLSAPFLFVRLLYNILGAFPPSGSLTFNPIFGNIYAQAFMQILMELICLILFTLAGLTVPSVKDGPERSSGGHWLRSLWQDGPTYKAEQDHAMQPRYDAVQARHEEQQTGYTGRAQGY